MQQNAEPVDRGDEAGEEAEIRTDDEGCRLPQEVSIAFFSWKINLSLYIKDITAEIFFHVGEI